MIVCRRTMTEKRQFEALWSPDTNDVLCWDSRLDVPQQEPGEASQGQLVGAS